MARFIGWLGGLGILFAVVHFYMAPYVFNGYGVSYSVALAMSLTVFTVGLWIRPVINHIIEPTGGDSREFFILLLGIAFAVMAFVFFLAGTRDWDGMKLGTFGDFIGGTLNPILTFLTFAGLLFTIVLQQRELHESRQSSNQAEKALVEEKRRATRQQFEYTFFQMIGLHNQIVGSMKLFVDNGDDRNPLLLKAREVGGRDCFRYFLENFYDDYREMPQFKDELGRINNAYEKFWGWRQQHLAHYFRYLYNVLRYVYEYEDDVGDKMRYVKLLRAQLSDYELLLLFYNALSKNGVNYQKYIEAYELFDNMPLTHVMLPDHLPLYSTKSYGSQGNTVYASDS